MTKHGWFPLVALTALAMTGMAAGCAETGGTRVVSKTDKAVAQTGQRLLVVSQLAWVDEAWAAAFEKAMLSELRGLVAASAVQSRNPLALQADKVRYAAELAGFKPDMVLVIEPGDGTVDARGRSLTRRFEAGLFRNYAERGRRELAWRATVSLMPVGMYISSTDMSVLARDVVKRLNADGVLTPSPSSGGRR